MHAYMHAHMHAYMNAFMHAYMHACMQAYMLFLQAETHSADAPSLVKSTDIHVLGGLPIS